MADDFKNSLQAIIVAMNRVVKVLAAHLQDPEAKKEVLLALGLNTAGAGSSPAIPGGSLSSIDQYVSKSSEDVDIAAFLSVVDDIISVSNAVDDFIHLVTDSEDPEIVTEFFDMLLQLCLTEAMRLRAAAGEAKAFYLVCKTLSFYEELGTPSGGISHFTENIAGFLKKVFQSFAGQDANQAALAAETISILLAVLSYKFKSVRDHLRVVYGFDPSPGSTSPVADQISERTLTLQFSQTFDDGLGNELTGKLLLSTAIRPQSEQGGGVEVWLGGAGKFERKFGDWKFSFAMEGTDGVDIRTKIKVEHDGEQAPLRWGDPKGTNLTIGNAGAEINASIADNDLDFKLTTKDSAFVLAKGKNDGFLDSILPDKGIHGNFDLGLGCSLRKGFYVDGGSGLSVLVPLHTVLGPLTLNSFFLKLTGNQAKDGVSVETSIGFTTSFFGFKASVERIGLIHDVSVPSGKKNLGFVNYGIAFKPPTGVGLSLNTGLITGGGFLYLDADKGEYFGALELKFKELFTLKAVGVINTKMPDGSAGFSLLIIITAEFTPIQLGFGFALMGVGGLLGLNRTTNIDVLREGIKTNTLKSILFPDDVVANMSRIISDIRQVFPPLNDRFLLCPMGELGWGTKGIFTLKLGLLLEIPLARIAILGILEASCPDKDLALLHLQVNFLGIIDFDNKYISFDASLYDSRLLLVYTLEGDMAFRLSWGDHPVFILSVGGFHPAFKEAPGDLQNMTRITISLLSGDNPRISLQSYFAVTSNTVQTGAKAELYAAAAGFNVYGFIGYDLLFQFDPFVFIAAVAAGLALRRGSTVLMSVQLSGVLSGPTPWDARGEASFSILFFDFSVGFHETWGDNPAAIQSEQEDLVQRLTDEINDNRNWKADIPDNNNLHVSLKAIEQPADKLVVHPFGVLSFSERLLPLGVSLQKFGQKVPKDVARFKIKPTDSGVASNAITEQFAPANFFTLSDSEKLSRPSFERMPSGFKITGSATLIVPATVNKSVDYELTYLRKSRGLRLFAGIYKYAKTLFKANLRAGAVAKSALSFTNKRVSVNAPDSIFVQEDGYAIANTSDLKLYQDTLLAGSYTEASDLLNGLVLKDPSIRGNVQIVSQQELNRN